MTTRTLLLTAACSLFGFTPLLAEQAADAAPASVPAVALVPAAPTHPFLDKALYPQWSKLTGEQALIDIRYSLDDARARMEAICRVKPGEETYENVFGAYERMDENLNRSESLLYHLASVMDSPAIRAAQEEVTPEVSAFSSSVIANEQLWGVIKRAAAAPWVKELSPAKQRFVQQVVDSFRDRGADLPSDKKERLAAIVQELSQLTLRFNKNVLDSNAAWELVVTDPAELAGCSETWMETARAAALAKGYGTEEKPQWLITQAYPSVGAVMRDCSVESTRRKCWEGSCTCGRDGAYDNAPIVARVMELRRELAELLGFASYADLTTAHRMVSSGKQAMSFVDDLMRRVKPAFERECEELLAYISKREGRQVKALAPWDRRYYMTQMSRERFALDPEELRPYFSCDAVLEGIFAMYGELLGIRITELPTVCLKPGESCPEGKVEVWHPEVRLYKVEDAATGQHLGSFYTDLFPRPVKREGAWVMPMHFGEPAADGKPHGPHLATLAGNLSPAAGEGEPALLTHYDVTVIFHEFGHMLHNMLSNAEVSSHMGTCVAWDFVELPSQLNEHWAWEPVALERFSRHYKTGEPMPADLVQKMLAGRYFMPATDNMGQLCIAKLDLEMHVNYDEKFKGRSIDEATNALLAPWRIPMTVETPSLMRTLTHCISGGYSAGYYSYKWAEVLCADAWTRFAKEGPLNPATGADYRRTVLSVGDDKPAEQVYRDFMHRDPDPDALLREVGLLPEKKAE